jgi:DNA-binding HxlR family transcriptional regulator
MAIGKLADSSCGVSRSLSVLGERWTLLVLRDALDGTTRFEDFRTSLGIAPDVLADRLATLVEAGVMTREAYREPGLRTRHEYQLTDAGRDLHVVVGALQQWGDAHLPWPTGPSVERRCDGDPAPLHVAFVDEHGREVPTPSVRAVRARAGTEHGGVVPRLQPR